MFPPKRTQTSAVSRIGITPPHSQSELAIERSDLFSSRRAVGPDQLWNQAREPPVARRLGPLFVGRRGGGVSSRAAASMEAVAHLLRDLSHCAVRIAGEA